MGDFLKFEIEIADEDCKFLAERLNVDMKTMVLLLTPQLVEYLKQVAIALKSGVPITSEEINATGKAVGEQVMKDSKVQSQ
jgi:hypothetical protein